MDSSWPQPVLSVRHLSKSFGGNTVLRDVSFDLLPGQIHALVGENGSGKSTFIKCISGYHQPLEGSEIRASGQLLQLPYGPSDARKFGFGFVHQNLGLVPTLSVADNLGLSRGFDTAPGFRVRQNVERKRAVAALAGLSAQIDPDELVSDLAQADKTLVAIARGLDSGGTRRNVLVLDEPTASLTSKEVEYLFAALKRLAAQGVGLIYVSHRLSEVLALADYVTVLRDGQVVANGPAAEFDERRLVNLIVGRSLGALFPEKTASTALPETLLEVKGLEGNRVSNLDFGIQRGEILGVAGLLGAGRSELGRLLFGAQKRKAGVVHMQGAAVDINSPAEALGLGIGYVPEDRLGKGGIPSMTVAENLTLSDLSEVWKSGRLRKRHERRLATDIIKKYRIRPADPDAQFSSLSGGNQQKAIIARALRLNPRLLILDEPFQGVDIGSKVDIYELIEKVAEEGMAVIVIDADFVDLCRLCDRVLVLRDGCLVGTLSGSERSRERIYELLHASGGYAQ